MEKNASRKDVIAPEQRIRSRFEIIRDYLAGIGFSQFGKTETDWKVYAKPIAGSNANCLFVFIKDNFAWIYKGLHKGSYTKAKELHGCTFSELRTAIGMVAKRN